MEQGKLTQIGEVEVYIFVGKFQNWHGVGEPDRVSCRVFCDRLVSEQGSISDWTQISSRRYVPAGSSSR